MKKLTKLLPLILLLGLTGCEKPVVEDVYQDMVPSSQKASYDSFSFSSDSKSLAAHTADTYIHSFSVTNVGNEVAVFYKPECYLMSTNSSEQRVKTNISEISTAIHGSDQGYFVLKPGQVGNVKFTVKGETSGEEVFLKTQYYKATKVSDYTFTADVYNGEETLYEDDYHLGHKYGVLTNVTTKYEGECSYIYTYQIKDEAPISVYSLKRPEDLQIYRYSEDIKQNEIKVLDIEMYQSPYLDYKAASKNNNPSLNSFYTTFFAFLFIIPLGLSVPLIIVLIKSIKIKKDNKNA